MKKNSVKQKTKLYEGKAKIVYETDNEDFLIQEFKDDALVIDGKKKGKIKNKGRYNNQISERFFNYLESYHVPTHFVSLNSENSMVIKNLAMIPVEVVMCNIATGSLIKRYGVKEGQELEKPVLEFYLKDEEKPDSVINEDNIVASGHADTEEIREIKRHALKINAILKSFFQRRNMLLVDFKLEFGRSKSGKIKVGDEISPDTCRIWDVESGEKLDKDRFRQDLSKIEQVYAEIHSRVLK